MNIGEFGGNLLINFAISGLLEFPSFALSLYALQRLGRRSLMITIMLGAGLGSFIAIPLYFVPFGGEAIHIVFAMVIKFFISISYYIIYIYSAEVYPTLVRQVGVGCNSSFSRFGSCIAPFVKELVIHLCKQFQTLIFTFCFHFRVNIHTSQYHWPLLLFFPLLTLLPSYFYLKRAEKKYQTL